jgi:hypothetical protein
VGLKMSAAAAAGLTDLRGGARARVL